MGLFGRSSGERRTTFDAEDRAIAERALGVCVREVTNAGFRWEFETHPSGVDHVARHAAQHANNPEHLQRRVAQLGTLVVDMSTFVDRPVQSSARPDLTRRVTQQDVDVYTNFYEAVSRYADTLDTHSPNSDLVREASLHVAQAVDPQAWREARYTVADMPSLTAASPRVYLEDVIWYTTPRQ